MGLTAPNGERIATTPTITEEQVRWWREVFPNGCVNATVADLDQRDRFPNLVFKREEWKMVGEAQDHPLMPPELNAIVSAAIDTLIADNPISSHFYGRSELLPLEQIVAELDHEDNIMAAIRSTARST